MRSDLPRILQITHGHPTFSPGGTEMVAMALHRHWRSQGVDSWYLGAAEPRDHVGNAGTKMIAMSEDNREAVIHTDGFIRFKLEQPDYFGPLREFASYLAEIRPDVVHFHHVLNFGLEAIHLARGVLPNARIILTLHDFYLICGNNGQLYRYDEEVRCSGPSLSKCMKCIPTLGSADFKMRELDIRATIRLVDELVSPSEFLKATVSANIEECPPIHVVENAYLGTPVTIGQARNASDRYRFGYFGNISRVKGAGHLLAAAHLLHERGARPFQVVVNGSQLFSDGPFDEEIAKAKAALGDILEFRGRYAHDEIGRRMEDVDCVVFPSLWPENAPLVVYEAIQHEKSVIAFPGGGAAEILNRYGTGIFAIEQSPAALADAMLGALLEGSQRPCFKGLPRTVVDMAADYARLYTDMLEQT